MGRAPCLALALVTGCGPSVTDIDGGAGGSDVDTPDETTGAFPGNDSGIPPNMSTSGEPGTTSGGDESTEDDDGSVFLPFPDLCGAGLEPGYLAHCTPLDCSLWDQDCPPGEKCVPWSNDGGPSHNALHCAPVQADPAAVGEPCVVQGNPVSGLDDCDFGSICWNVDPETLEGTCVAQCTGSPENPSCESTAVCAQGSSGPLALCLPSCHPLALDACDASSTCVPYDEAFACVSASGQDLGPGESCESANACAAGLACLAGDAVGCQDTNCCASLCDLTQSEPNPLCAAGQVCTPWYEGEAPKGYDDVGVCVVEG